MQKRNYTKIAINAIYVIFIMYLVHIIRVEGEYIAIEKYKYYRGIYFFILSIIFFYLGMHQLLAKPRIEDSPIKQYMPAFILSIIFITFSYALASLIYNLLLSFGLA